MNLILSGDEYMHDAGSFAFRHGDRSDPGDGSRGVGYGYTIKFGSIGYVITGSSNTLYFDGHVAAQKLAAVKADEIKAGKTVLKVGYDYNKRSASWK